jgi:hypothetical protein
MDFKVLGDVADIETIATGSGIRDLVRLRKRRYHSSAARFTWWFPTQRLLGMGAFAWLTNRATITYIPRSVSSRLSCHWPLAGRLCRPLSQPDASRNQAGA